MKCLLQNGLGHFAARLTIGSGGFIDRSSAFESKEGLDLAHHLAAGTVGLKNLPDPAPERTKQRENALAAVLLGVAFAEQFGWECGSQAHFDLGQGSPTKLFDLGFECAHGAKLVTPSREKRGHRCNHIERYIYRSIDNGCILPL